MNPQFYPELEQCKELKKNGFPQDTEFWWVQVNFKRKDNYLDKDITENWKLIEKEKVAEINLDLDVNYEHIAAPISDELLRRLPAYIIGKDNWEYTIRVYKLNAGVSDGYGIDYWRYPTNSSTTVSRDNKSLSNALSKMYNYLKGEKLI